MGDGAMGAAPTGRGAAGALASRGSGDAVARAEALRLQRNLANQLPGAQR